MKKGKRMKDVKSAEKDSQSDQDFRQLHVFF